MDYRTGFEPSKTSKVRSEREIREELWTLERLTMWPRTRKRWHAIRNRMRTLRWVLGESEDGPGQTLIPNPCTADFVATPEGVQGADRGPDPNPTGK